MDTRILLPANGINKTGDFSGFPEKSITETVVNGFFTVDSKWTVIYWNEAAEKILHVKSKDIIGKNLWREFVGILPLDFYIHYHKAFLQDIPTHFEEYWGEKGAWFDVITYHFDDTLSVSFKSSNKSAHPQFPNNSEQQLQIIRRLYQFITVVTNDCLWEWDLQTHEIFWIDGGHKRVFGYHIENALIPESFWKHRIHPDDKEGVLTALAKTITESAGSLWETEYRFKKVTGEYAYVHDRGHIIYDENKKAIRMIGATQDISIRKQAEIELLKSERKFSLIARQTVNAIIITDAEGKITWVNDAFTRITEYQAEEVIGRKPGSFLQGKDTDLLTIAYMRGKIRDREPFGCDIINYTKTGRQYWVHIQGQILFDEEGNFERFFAIQTDITEKILLENKLAAERLSREREITAAVLTAQENERSDIGKEIHDNLGQILGAANLYIQMAKKYDANKDLYLEKSSIHITTVIAEIRKIAKDLLTPGLYIIGLTDSITILIEDIMAVHSMIIELQIEDFDEEELDQKLQLTIFRIVQEQLNNIIKHAEARNVVIRLDRQDNQVILQISDDGEGCNMFDKQHGVGLINIRSRAALYKGSVDIVSSTGKGFDLKVVLNMTINV
jgi:PAS domain S-box-containing protein